MLPSFVKGLDRYSQLTHLAINYCAPVQDKNDDLGWDCVMWTKAEAGSVMKAFAAALKKLQQLRHLELLLKLDELQGEDEDRNWSVGSAEMQPVVQAAAGLPHAERVYVSGDRSGPALIDRRP